MHYQLVLIRTSLWIRSLPLKTWILQLKRSDVEALVALELRNLLAGCNVRRHSCIFAKFYLESGVAELTHRPQGLRDL